ncbi:hypothetical protein GQ600_8179 [Phytophthora cactorum]|nr:hypothetical protein GQ600_8179 [Phytophthora cactorum]
MRSTWVAKYTFDLEPVSVERIDVLASMLRDQAEGLKRMERELQNIQGGQTPMYLQLEASLNLCWNKIESDVVIVSKRISIVVSCISDDDCDEEVDLMKNKKYIQISECGYSKDCYESIPLNYIERMEKNDELTVVCTCGVGTSYLSIVRLGN